MAVVAVSIHHPDFDRLPLFQQLIDQKRKQLKRCTGFIDMEIIAPPDNSDAWGLMVKFESLSQLQSWMASEEYTNWLQNIQKVTDDGSNRYRLYDHDD